MDITPILNNISFDRNRVMSEDATVTFNIRTELTENVENDLCKLLITAETRGAQSDGPDIFTLTLGVEYLFKVMDKEAFSSSDSQERLKLATNTVYLDFRKRLTLSMESTGMSGFKLPYSIELLRDSK
ncbi:MAG: hypothetical protein E7J69_06350 [Atlantibacter hermannii]|uniref:hypothetical protein n=2 Tax=Atlantibacter hermannii TaxID=565 RepID=UPI0029076983|nr:hypothetical protein [Atlantibacter hermannii]MDU7812124.1 hypothetical protein [Atlantibacter hermannii]